MTPKAVSATFAVMVACVIAVSGCASIRSGAHGHAFPPSVAAQGADAADEGAQRDEYDPWQRFNTTTFEFNRRVDRYALRPVAKGWKAVIPERIELMLSNAFDNVNAVPRVVNNVLQAKWDGAGREVGRFLINSSAGVGGFFDPAKEYLSMGGSPADFGQTLGKWGTGPGPYLILPFMEPLTVRDGIGKLVDAAMDPLSYILPLIPVRLSLTAASKVNERALNDESLEAMEDAVLDLYSAVRNGYLQRREYLLHE